MLKKTSDISVLKYVLDHIRTEDKQELIALYSDDWYEKVFENFSEREFLVLYGLDKAKNQVPIAIGGVDSIFDKSQRIACVWLLSTFWVMQNKTLFFKTLKTQALLVESEFDILFNFVYESNQSAKKWIKKLGFSFDNPNPAEFSMEEGFEFFYKLTERSY